MSTGLTCQFRLFLVPVLFANERVPYRERISSELTTAGVLEREAPKVVKNMTTLPELVKKVNRVFTLHATQANILRGVRQTLIQPSLLAS